MTSPPKTSSSLLDAYAAMNGEEASIVRLLSVTFARVSQHFLLTMARQLAYRTADGKAFTAASLGAALESLASRKLVGLDRKEVRCNLQIMHRATLDAIRDGSFQEIVRVVQLSAPMVSEWGSSYYRSPDHALRDVRIACYLGKTETALDKVELCLKLFPYELQQSHPLVAVCNQPFDEEWFRTRPEPLQVLALLEILDDSWRKLLPAEVPVRTFNELVCGRTDAHPLLVDFLGMQLMLRGRLGEAEAKIGENPTPGQSALSGWCALLRGERLAAIDRFEAGLARLKKETGKRKTFFEDLTGPVFIVALIGSGERSHLDRASEFCDFVVGRKEWPHQELYRTLQHVIGERNGERGMAQQVERTFFSGSPTAALFGVLALYWCGSAKTKAKARELPEIAGQARQAGYLWLADELELTALACGVESAEGREAQERYQAQGMTPLWRNVEMTASWENALQALIRLNDGTQAPAAKTAAQSRLIWHFQEEYGGFEITPREQKLTAGGKWSAGRNLPLKRLAEEAEQLGFLSEQDVRICGLIKRERGYGYGFHARDAYSLDAERALQLMVGHQQVYLDPAGTVRLEIVPGEPELQLRSEGNTLTMQIFPPFEQHRNVCIVKESPTRLKIFEAKEEYRKIAAIVGNGLKLPARAKSRALEAINSLSSILTVHSDIGGSAAETVPADPTPCFHLLPYNDGLKVELLVRPFADAGPYFAPGGGGETVLAEIDGKRVQTRRELRVEVRRAADAVALLPALPESEEADGAWLVPAPETALELLLQLRELREAIRVAWPEGAKFKVRPEATTGHCRLAIKQAKDWFELEGELKLDEGLTLSLQQLVQLAKDGVGRFLPLGDGEFFALSAQLRKRLDDLAAFSEAHGKAFRFHPLTAGVFEEFAGEAGEFSSDRAWVKQLKRLSEAQAFQPQLPTTLMAELRGYQEEGFNWLSRLAKWGVGACLADDMGLGKTVQALAQILTMAPDGPSLVVAPTSVCLNWESEAQKFAPTLNAIVFGGGNRERSLKDLKPFDLVICSYGLLQQEGELLARVKWQAIVLDEAQAIKNMATKRSQAAMELSGAFKMVATGTPIENHLGELWNVFRFINPGLLGSLKQFNVKFASPIEKTRDKKARARLKRLIQPFILRRTKNQVLEELPSRTEITIRVEMGEDEAALYEALRRSALETLAGIGKVRTKGEQHLKILAELMRLRRACCNPRLVLPDTPIPSAKLAAFGEILEELQENRHKALVFSQFVGHLEIIRGYVEKVGIPYQYLDGATSPSERKKRVEAFQAGKGELFLISLKAGGVGLNLTAADYVIHMDPWWNPAVEDQASDRAHRIGQQRPVTIYRLVTKGTIEEKIVGLHLQKRGLADSLLDESDLSGKVSAEDLLALLRSEKEFSR